jgi:membrane-associated phospholipid phosphatase
VSATEGLTLGIEQGPKPRFAHWTALRRTALALYLLAVILWSAEYGIPVQRELVIAWVCGALACTSIGRQPTDIFVLVGDWLPIVAVLALYDFTRGAADSLGVGVHVQTMLDFDRFLFGETPTEWLQDHINQPGVVNWWDVGFTLTYTSYFIVPFAVAGALWIRDRPAFKGFTRRLVSLAIAGVTTYILFPAAPPWMAAQDGLIDGIQRSTGQGWEVIGGGTAGWFSEGQALGNPVAAVPSLHTAFTALVAMFLWNRVNPWLRPLLALYPLAMGVTLMATGEHYFFDVLLGYIYAAGVMLAWGWWERRRARTRLATLNA